METHRLVRKAGKTFTTGRPWLSIKPSANLAGLLALPCRIAEFSCVPPHNEEEKTVDPDELSATNTELLNNYFWQMVIYISHYFTILPHYTSIILGFIVPNPPTFAQHLTFTKWPGVGSPDSHHCPVVSGQLFGHFGKVYLVKWCKMLLPLKIPLNIPQWGDIMAFDTSP